MEKICDKLCTEEDYDHGGAGVLLSQDIEYFATTHKMIYPFNPKNLKPAGIRLCLGEEFAIGGKVKRLCKKYGKDELIIPPFEVAIISTDEIINLPRYLIARWNLRVSLVYKGLLWTGALQVDPGWCGHLYCPIYNLSNEEVSLKLGEPIVLMDFVKTTKFERGKSKEYNRPPKRTELKKYNYGLKSALFTKAGQRLDEFDKRINRIESLTGMVVASIAVLFTALTVIVTATSPDIAKSANLNSSFFWWPIASMSISIIALFLSIRGRIKWEVRKGRWKILVAIFYIIIGAALFYLLQPPLKKLFMIIVLQRG